MAAENLGYWLRRQGAGGSYKSKGPLSGQQMRHLAGTGQLKPTDEISTSPQGPWRRADAVKGLTLKTSAASAVPVRDSQPEAQPQRAIAAAGVQRVPDRSAVHEASETTAPASLGPPPLNAAHPPALKGAHPYLAMDRPVAGKRPVYAAIEYEYYSLVARFARAGQSVEVMKRLNAQMMQLGNAGFAQASFDVAAGFDTGLAGERDPERAWSWFVQAAEQGHAAAGEVLCRAILDGKGPVPMSRTRAPGVVGLGWKSILLAEELEDTKAGCFPMGLFTGPPRISPGTIPSKEDPVGALLHFTDSDAIPLSLTIAVLVPSSHSGPTYTSSVLRCCAMGILVVEVEDSDFLRLHKSATADAERFDLWLEPLPELIHHGAAVVVRSSVGDRISEPVSGRLILSVELHETRTDRRTKSGTRTVSHNEDLVADYRQGLGTRHKAVGLRFSVWRERSRPTVSRRESHQGWMPMASRFNHDDAAKALWPSSLGVDYKKLGSYTPLTMARVRAEGVGARPYVERVFWLHVAWQFQPHWGVKWLGVSGCETPVFELTEENLKELKLEEWAITKQDAKQAIQLAKQWIAKFWPAIATRDLPVSAMIALQQQASALSKKGIPLPSAEADLRRLQERVDANVTGPQPPGIALLKHKGVLSVCSSLRDFNHMLCVWPLSRLPVPVLLLALMFQFWPLLVYRWVMRNLEK